MTMKRWSGTTQVDIATAKRWSGTTFVDLTVAKRWTGSAWVDIPLPGGGSGGLSVTINTSYVEEVQHVEAGSSAITMTAGPAAVTATGGTGSGPTYSWTRLSGSSGITATAPNSASTNFTALVTKNSSREATFRCTVVRGVETETVQVTVRFEYFVGILQ